MTDTAYLTGNAYPSGTSDVYLWFILCSRYTMIFLRLLFESHIVPHI